MSMIFWLNNIGKKVFVRSRVLSVSSCFPLLENLPVVVLPIGFGVVLPSGIFLDFASFSHVGLPSLYRRKQRLKGFPNVRRDDIRNKEVCERLDDSCVDGSGHGRH